MGDGGENIETEEVAPTMHGAEYVELEIVGDLCLQYIHSLTSCPTFKQREVWTRASNP